MLAANMLAAATTSHTRRRLSPLQLSGFGMEDGLTAAAAAEGPDQALRHRIRVAFDLFDDAANGTVPSE